VLGEMKLSVYDTVAYMSVPAFIFLMPFCLVKKPVPGEWPQVLGMDKASDFDIMMMTRKIAPSTFELFILSGFFLFCLQHHPVQNCARIVSLSNSFRWQLQQGSTCLPHFATTILAGP